jgi:hypothetical protein
MVEIFDTNKNRRASTKIRGNNMQEVLGILNDEFGPGPKSIFGTREVLKELAPGKNSILRKKRA